MDVPPYEPPKKVSSRGTGLKKKRGPAGRMSYGLSSITVKARAAYKRLGRTRAIGLLVMSLAALVPPIIVGIGGSSSLIQDSKSSAATTISFQYTGRRIVYITKYASQGGIFGECTFQTVPASYVTPKIKFAILDEVNFNNLVDGEEYSTILTTYTNSANKASWSTKIPSGGYYYLCFYFDFSSSTTVKATGWNEIDSTPPTLSCNITQGQLITDTCTIAISTSDSQTIVKSLTVKINGITRLSLSYPSSTYLPWPKEQINGSINKVELVALDNYDSGAYTTVYTRGINYTAPQASLGAIPGVVNGTCTFPVYVNRTDDIKEVRFLLNNILYSREIPPWISSTTIISWNSRASGNGTFELKVIVVDFLDNITMFTRTVVSDNDYVWPQFIAISGPPAISGPITISVSAHDNVALRGISLYVNHSLFAYQNLTGCDAVVNFTWDPGSIIEGSVLFTLELFDEQGNYDAYSWHLYIGQTVEPDPFWNAFTIVAVIASIAVVGLLVVAYLVKSYKAKHPQSTVQAPAAAPVAQHAPAVQPVQPTFVNAPDDPPWVAPDATQIFMPPSSFHDLVGQISIPDPTATTTPRTARQNRPAVPAAPAVLPAKPPALDPAYVQVTVSDYGKLEISGATKVPRVYVDLANINVQAKPVSSGRYTKIGSSGKIEVDLFCKQCHQHVLVQEFDPTKEYVCTACHTKLSELAAPVKLQQRDLVKLDPARLDCVEILMCLYKEGYFTRSGRLRKKTIQKLHDDGKISVQDVPKLIDLLLSVKILKGTTDEMVYIDPEIMRVSSEAELSKKVLDCFDEYDEKIESFRF